MSWAKIDDQFFTHPKVIDLPKDAKLLFLVGLTYCAAQLTDGLITPGALRVIAATADVPTKEAAALLAAGLWEKVDAGWQIHDWIDCEPLHDPSIQELRNTQEYRRWRKAVMERDHFTCRKCRVVNCMLHAHHIKPFATYPNGRFDVENGLTLCVPCHEIIHGRELQ